MAGKISDKERLDWLSRQVWPFELGVWNVSGMPGESDYAHEWRTESRHGNFLGIGNTPRKAIDAAIRSERSGRRISK